MDKALDQTDSQGWIIVDIQINVYTKIYLMVDDIDRSNLADVMNRGVQNWEN